MNRSLCLLLVSLTTLTARADDWPQWRGPDRNGISKEKGWTSEWPADGPPVLWKAQAGIGFASFSAVGDHVFTTGFAGEQDTVFCYGAATGKVVWKHSYPSELGDKYYEGGTSATPTAADGKIYQLSRWGDAICLDAASGKVIWSKNVATENDLPVPDWGFAGSPVVAGDLLLLNVGQHGVALAKATGAVKWKSAAKPAGYSTPLPVPGHPGQAFFSSDNAYFRVDLATGKALMEYPWKTQYGVNAADPVVIGDQVFISSGYKKGCALFGLSGPEPVKAWENKLMRSQFNSCVLVDGHLYGPDGNDGDNGSLKCMEIKTGKVKWERKGFGVGGVTVADGKLITLSARGELQVAPVSPEKFDPVAEAQVLGGRCWTTPVLANGRIFCRNAAGEVVCLNVKAGK